MKKLILSILTVLNHAERKKLSWLIILDLVIGALDIAFLAGLLLVINYYTASNPAGHFLIFDLVYRNTSLLLTGIFFVLFGLKNCLGYYISASENSFFYQVASRLSRQNILHYLGGDHYGFIQTDSSVHIRKISQQPIEFSNYILTNLQQIITQSILICFTVIAILFYHPTLFMVLFIILSAPVALLAWFIKSRLSIIRAHIKTTSEKTIQHLQESLSGFVESNVYQKNDFFADRYDGYQRQLNENISTQQSLQGLPSRLIEVFAIFGLFILIAISRTSTHSSAVDLVNVGVFMAASYKIIPGIVKILNSGGQIKTYRFIINDLLNTSRNNKNANDSHSTEPLTSVTFKGVAFQYKHHNILSDLNLEMLPGDFAGISGDSGSGKTTIINLLLGFLEQKAGEVCINERGLTGSERRQFFGRISYLKQQPFFINDSILKNITLTDGDYDHTHLNQILKFCGIDIMLNRYPDGIHKLITENGKNISGGQRQRIALARALYHDFDLLILDEPFSELDEFSEKALLSKLKQLAANGKMILFITHNKESLAFCNKIIIPDGVYET